MIRVLLAEDQAMIRGALAALLTGERDIEVVAEAGDGETAVAEALRVRPQVALLDIEMPGNDGLWTAAELRRQLPECRLLILTVFGRPGYLRRAIDRGVASFLLKDSPPDKLADAIRRAVAGETVIDPKLAVLVQPGRPSRRSLGGPGCSASPCTTTSPMSRSFSPRARRTG
jgi:two-component system, NarL family, response regulator DesR